jgi:hypothetical protein
MSTQDLLERVRTATPQEQRLVARVLATPKSGNDFIVEALLEISRQTDRGHFLESIVCSAMQLALQGLIPNHPSPSGLNLLVQLLNRPETLADLAPHDPLVGARLKGLLVKQQLLYENGAPLKSEEVAQLLKISRQAVDKRRKNGQLLAVSLGRRGYYYPLWQFQEGKVLPGLEAVLKTLKNHDPWTQLLFLKTGDIRLAGATPIEILHAGDIDAVIAAAIAYGTHGAA